MPLLNIFDNKIFKVSYLLIIISKVCLFFLLYLLGINIVYSADLLISPATGSYNVGSTFTITVQANPRGQQINAVEAELRFDPSELSVVSVSREGSAFSLWTNEPSFSNSAGTVQFGGGNPTPFSTQSPLMTVTFRATGDGDASVSFTEATVLAADGFGTDVLNNMTGGTYTLSVADTTPTQETSTPTPTPTQTTPQADTDSDAAIAFGDPPRAPVVGSTDWLDSELWYTRTVGKFTWDIPFDVNAVAIAISTSSNFVPSTNSENIVEPPVESFEITEGMISDGIYYLSVQFRNQVGWGAVNNRKFMVDSTPPDSFTIDVIPGSSDRSFPTLRFESRDAMSGISHYDMEIANREPVRITPDEARLGYLLRDLEDGTYTVTITAFDKAGNRTISTAPVLITAGWLPPETDEEKDSFWSFLTGTTLLIIFLILIIVGQSIYIYFDRKQRNATEHRLRRETKEIEEQMTKIFSALRDEIYDQINTITKRPRLSKREKETVEQLNQALEVSETLIEKEINDVQSILK